MTSTRVRTLAGLALASTFLLTGCGSVSGFNPGVAARVGDHTVSADRVQSVAADYCSAAEPQLQGQVLPNHYLNGRVAGSLTLRSAADQVMAEHHVSVDSSYATAVAKAEQQLSTLGTAERDALVEVQGAELYVQAAELSLGRASLGGSPTDADAQAAGEKIFLAWLDDHDVRIDPKYGVDIEKGKAVLADTGVSYALSDTATKADASTPDTTYAAALPDDQRCGSD